MNTETQIKNAESIRHSGRSRFVRFGYFCLSAFALYLSLFVWYFWSNAGYSDDRYAVLSAMLRLKLTSEQVVSVGGRPDVILVETKVGYQKTFDQYMARLGWQYVDRMGSAVYFRKGNQKLKVMDGAITAYFRIQGLGRNPYKSAQHY